MLVLPLNNKHDRKGFDCGDAHLNGWLKQTARQHKEKGISSTFVSVTDETSVEILGFYAISLAELLSSTLSDYLKDICVRHDVQCKSLVI